LLDTHALLWAIDGSRKLSTTARRILSDEQSDLVVSIASLWEIALKHQAGKLDLGLPLNQLLSGILEQSAWRVLPVGAGIFWRCAAFQCCTRTHSTACWLLWRRPTVSPC
jgi:PIN domain nuclease of toxin-antitoxin system